MSTPAGWYPQDDGRQRYWDGSQWTEHFAPGSAATAAGQTVGATATVPGEHQVASTGTSARPWFKKKRFVIPAGLAGVIILGSALGAGGAEPPAAPTALESSASTSASRAPVASASATPTPMATAASKPVAPQAAAPKPAAPKLSVAQENARGSAESYLELSGFSKKGLIGQLKFEGYSAGDIDAALATMRVDWNAEAAQSAKSYVEMSHFSRKSLIGQLKFEGYTSKQAAHGADSVGL